MSLDDFRLFVAEVKRRSPIVEVIGEDAKIERRGSYVVCCSPLRGEKDPSFYIYPEQDSWYDFGISEGGDVIAYVMRRDGCTFRDAVETLARRVGMQWARKQEREDEFAGEIAALTERSDVSHLMWQAAEFYHRRLPRRIREHLRTEYGFTDETIDKAKIGWASVLGVEMVDVRGVKPERLAKTGLFVRKRDGSLFDFFEDRIVFPYFAGGSCVYMIGRRYDGETWQTSNDDWERGKYKKQLVHNEKHPYVSTHIANDWFFGEDTLVRPCDVAIITEGVTDCIMAHQCGYPAASPVTTRPSAKQVPKMITLTERAGRVVIVNDNEASGAGTEGARFMAAELYKVGRDVRIATLPLPEGETKIDLCAFVRDHGKPALDEVVSTAKRYPEFLLDEIPDGLEGGDLEQALRPIAEMVAHCSPIERESYVVKMARRFNITRRAVNQLVAMFTPEQPRAERDDRIKGRVFEDEAGYYYVRGNDGTVDVISSFTLTPTERVTLDDGTEVLRANIQTRGGKLIKGHVFRRRAWRSKRDFVDALGSLDLQWTGSDDNVQGVLRLVSDVTVPQRRGVTQIGYHETPAGPRFVTGDQMMGPEGWIEDPDLVYLGTNRDLPDRLDVRLPPRDEVQTLAREALPLLFELNDLEVIAAMLGWFYASPLAPRVRKALGHFPILWIWATQGAGKSTLLREVFWPLVGVSKNANPFSCTDTNFSMLDLLAATNANAVVLDEFRPKTMPRANVERVQRFVRRLYAGEVERRGRPDLSVQVFALAAPLCIAGEAMPEGDPAVMERVVPASPSKNAITPARQRILDRLRAMDLAALAGPYIQFTLTRHIDRDLEAARTITNKLLRDAGRAVVPPRCYDNLLTMVLGINLFEAWAEDLGVDLPDADLVPAFRAIVDSLLEGDGASVRDAFDDFLESLATAAHTGLLKVGTHYAYSEEGFLCLHLPSCYSVYLEQRARERRDDATNGLRALKRIVAEKHARESYIVDPSRDIVLGQRCPVVVIDITLIPRTIDFQPFPRGIVSRSWAHDGGDQWN